MATMNPHANERRHIPDRRAIGSRQVVANRMHAAEWIPMLLLIIGGLNWGLVGLFDIDLVAMLFGEGSLLSRIVYGAVGLSALYALYMGSRLSKRHT